MRSSARNAGAIATRTMTTSLPSAQPPPPAPPSAGGGDAPAVAIICPLYGRPERTAAFVEACEAAATGPQDVVLVVNAGRHHDYAAAIATNAIVLSTGPRRPGDWARKVNLAYRMTDHPLMALCGDDVRPRRGWYDEVVNAYNQGWGVIGTQDLGNRRVIQGFHSTHPVVARWYATQHGTIDEPGIVVPECYGHNFVDDELVETAKYRGAWTFCNGAVLEHLHPNWHKAPPDDVYRLGMSSWDDDRNMFERRRCMWGGH